MYNNSRLIKYIISFSPFSLLSLNVIFYENHFPFYMDNIDTNFDTHDIFKHLLPSISDNNIVVATSIRDIVSETVLPYSFPATYY